MKAASVPLARNGEACCRISLPMLAGPAEEYAAEELRTHILDLAPGEQACFSQRLNVEPVA